MKIYLSLLFLFLLTACGDGSFDINRDDVDSSQVDLRGDPDTGTGGSAQAKAFFISDLFPLTKTDGSAWATDSTKKGCLGSGCHTKDTDRPTFFQQDPGDQDFSWQYARVRRKKILFGNYAPEPPSDAKTLRNAYRDWETGQI